MVAVPLATAVTLPLLSTVATAELLVFQLTDLLVALLGETVAVKVEDSPFFVKVTLVLLSATEVGVISIPEYS